MKEEVEKAINCLHNDKASGPNGINCELICNEHMIEPLNIIVNEIIDKEEIPEPLP